METIKLEVQTREVDGKANQLRKTKYVPGVYYGKGEKSIPVKIEYQAMRKAYIEAGYSSLIDLNMDGKTKKVLIHDIQIHPLKGTIQHVDFLHVNLKQEITTEVPVEIEGVSPAVKDHGGVLNTVKHELEVKCLPTDIPHAITVNISGLLELSSAIYIKDIVLPKGVAILDDPDDVVVVVNAPRVEEETPIAAEGEAPVAEEAKEGETTSSEKSA